MAEVNPSARVQVRGVAMLRPPGHCALCGSGNRDRYVDPAIFFDYEGQIYFCDICLNEMATVMGCLVPEEAQFLIEQNNVLQARNQQLEAVRIEYDRLVAALRSLNADGALNFDAPGSSDLLIEVPEKQSDGDSLVNDEPTIDRTRERSESVKSVADPRHSDVNGDAGSNQSIPAFVL